MVTGWLRPASRGHTRGVPRSTLAAAGALALTVAVAPAAHASPLVSVHVPAAASTNAPIDVTYKGMSDDASTALRSFYAPGATTCPQTADAASSAGATNAVYETSPPPGTATSPT